MKRPPSTAPELAGYDFVKLLGTGGFSDVFLYEQKLPKRKVAVKVLLLDELNAATRASFYAEANLMAQLSTHPYIVTIYHADVAEDGRPYFVMEYCSGPSLGDRYKRESFAVADALRIGVRLSSAIATAHASGILHRDIKPANVLTNDYGWPALTDFGISSAVEGELPLNTMTLSAGGETGSTGATESQSVGMSVPWSPPEMFEDDPQPDVRSDVFALAATIHTLLAGRTPFEIPGRSNGTLDLIGRIERGAITPIGRDDVPRSLVAVLQKGMASRRTERFATAVDFARALQRVELELGYSPTTIEVPNLVVVDERPDPGGEDETRMRSVATISAQPVVAPSEDETRVRNIPVIAPEVPSTPQASPEVGVTVVRPKRQVVPPTASAEPEPSPQVSAVDEAPRSKRGLVIGLSSAVAAVAVGAIIVSSLLNGQSPREPIDEPTKRPGDSAVITDQVPIPINGVAVPSADGTSVTFSWENPSPVEGDTFRYARSEQPDARMPLAAPTVTLDGLQPGARVCVNAYILRSGQLSADPLQICYPEA